MVQQLESPELSSQTLILNQIFVSQLIFIVRDGNKFTLDLVHSDIYQYPFPFDKHRHKQSRDAYIVQLLTFSKIL